MQAISESTGLDDLIALARKRRKPRDHMSEVAALACVVCRNERLGDTPACLHHVRTGYGRGERASDYEVLPLCPTHHQHSKGGQIAFHDGPRIWEARYGTELELLEQTLLELLS